MLKSNRLRGFQRRRDLCGDPGDVQLSDANLQPLANTHEVKTASLGSAAEEHRKTVKYKLDLQWGNCTKLPTNGNVNIPLTNINTPRTKVSIQLPNVDIKRGRVMEQEKFVVDDKTRRSIIKNLYLRFL